MAQEQIVFRANTQASVFPLLSSFSGQSVLVPDRDQTYIANVNPSDSSSPVERGIPQILYGHNIMPSTYGFQSIGYKEIYEGFSEGNAGMKRVELVITTEGVRTYVSGSSGRNTIYALDEDGLWSEPDGAPNYNENSNPISVATVNGVSYICVARTGVYKYSLDGNSFIKVTLAGLADANILGVVASSGYLIVWSRTGVSWSSTIDPEDFVPSDISGAGGGMVQEAEGDIILCKKTSYGFIVYTTNNAVSCTYSGNTSFPFNFKSIPGAGGIASPDMVTEETVGAQYAYTTNGMQQIYHTGAKTVLAAITDFVAGSVYEDYSGGSLYIQYLFDNMKKKLALIADRYLIMSYGPSWESNLQYALVVDLLLGRMGKLKIEHTTVFELRNLTPDEDEIPRRSIAFLTQLGAVQVLDFSPNNIDTPGVIILGKYQIIHSHETSLQSVQIENIPENGDVEVTSWLSYTGKGKADTVDGVLDTSRSDSNSKFYLFDCEAKNHSILIEGNFNLTTMLIGFKLGGDN